MIRVGVVPANNLFETYLKFLFLYSFTLSNREEVIDRNTDPVNKLLLAGTVPVNKLISLLAGTPLTGPKGRW